MFPTAADGSHIARLELDLNAMPAHPGYYREMLKRLHPVQCKISKKPLQNINSDVRFGVDHVGPGQCDRSYLTPMTPEAAIILRTHFSVTKLAPRHAF